MPETGEVRIGGELISYTVARSRRRRRSFAFEMESASTLKVSAPQRASLTAIRLMIERQAAWIKRRLAEFHNHADQLPAKPLYDHGTPILYLGRAVSIDISHDKAVPQGCTLRPHRMIVNLHSDILLRSSLREEVRLEVLLWLKKRAKAKIRKRTDYWAKRLGVRYRQLLLSKAERRWGSCSSQDIVRLNWCLIMAPQPILDYVVVHELSHIQNKNHGPRFWAQVGSVIPDYKARRQRLRVIGRQLMLV